MIDPEKLAGQIMQLIQDNGYSRDPETGSDAGVLRAELVKLMNTVADDAYDHASEVSDNAVRDYEERNY